ncbi:MAG: kelch repeat-containing protein [Saprospiraceae bacterium]
MKKMLLFRALAALLLLYLIACSPQKPTELNFFEVNLQEGERANVPGTLHLRANLKMTGGIRADSCGFLWSLDPNTLNGSQPHGQRLPAMVPVDAEDLFEADLSGLQPEQTIYFRAFASRGERTAYHSVVGSFTPGQVTALLPELMTVSNDTAWVSAVLTAEGFDIESFGFVYGPFTDPFPESGHLGSVTVPVGTGRNTGAFSTAIPHLEFNTKYHYRSFAISGGQKLYSPTVGDITVQDGWRKMGALFHGYQGAAVAVQNDRAYFAFGCDNIFCAEGNLQADLWSFDPSANGGNGNWMAAKDFPAAPATPLRTDATMFAIGDTVYMLFGENSGVFYNDFWKYIPSQNIWLRKPNPVPGVLRIRASAFVLPNGKAYVGAGEKFDQILLLPVEVNDFWEFSPANGSWRKVKSLPLKYNPGDSEHQLGRTQAMSFTIGAHGYVGSGKLGITPLNDFWEFSPPDPGNLQDSGQWVLRAFFPGLGRIQGAAFCLGNTGYFGTGYNYEAGFLDDFWKYDALADNWSKLPPFPGGKRFNASAFANNGFGYLGLGRQKIPDSTGWTFVESLRSEFWRYYPKN